jgi:hypothetical protein
MYIVLDANVLVSDYRLRSPAVQMLTQLVERQGVYIVVPAVAVHEAVNKYEEQTEDVARKLARFVDPSECDEQLSPDRYRARLRTWLNQVRAYESPYPRTSHEDLGDRPSNGLRP